MANTNLDCTRIAAALRPLDDETHTLQSAKDSITNILLHNQSLVRVARIVPAGSFAKGTALRDNWELDLVYLSPDVSSWTLASIHRQVADLFQKNFPFNICRQNGCVPSHIEGNSSTQQSDCRFNSIL